VGGGRPRRVRWGQNFLSDANIARAIVEWSGVEGRSVLEIGPGRGALTELLRERASRLCLIEIDPGLAEDWRRRFADDEAVDVVAADALEVDFTRLCDPPLTVVANLPYESGTAILMRLLESRAAIERIVVMLQKEVCERIVAQAGDSNYGLLALHSQLLANVEKGRVVAPSCFAPPPKVDSQLLRLTPLAKPRYPVGDSKRFSAMLRAAFSTRRKMLRNSLGPWLANRLGHDQVDAAFAAAEIEASARPQSIALESFARLATYVDDHSGADA